MKMKEVFLENIDEKELLMEEVSAELNLLSEDISNKPNSMTIENCKARLLSPEKQKIRGNFTPEEQAYIKSLRNKYDGKKLYEGWERMQGKLPSLYSICSKEDIKTYFEFVFIALAESKFDSKAVSGTNCKGLWQFDSNTAKRFKISKSEIFSYEKPSIAAIKYCSHNFKMLKEKNPKIGNEDAFKFATLAYNIGPTKAMIFARCYDGNYSEFFLDISNKRYGKLKSSLSVYNKNPNNPFQAFPNEGKLKESMEYVYKVFCMRDIVEGYEKGEIYLKNKDKTAQRVDLMCRGKQLTILRSRPGFRYSVPGRGFQKVDFKNEEDFHRNAFAGVLNDVYGNDRQTIPHISKEIYQFLDLRPSKQELASN